MTDTVNCPKCARASPVKRTTCLYCGEPLPVTQAALGAQVPSLRPAEEWESGFSVVLAPLDAPEPTDHQVNRLCELAAMDESLAREIFAARTDLPVARVASEDEATLLARLLGAADLGATIVADADLALASTSRRVRELRLSEDELSLLVLWGDWVTLPRAELRLAVEGRLLSSRLEIIETGGRKNRELVDTSESRTESYVIDLYGATLGESFRVKTDSFNFECLGGRPAPFLEANVNRLSEVLLEYVGASRYDATYRGCARLIAHAWPHVSRERSKGMLRRGDLKRYSVSAVEMDVLAQFTRYSRMRFALARGLA